MEENKIIHRDIKLENILFGKRNDIATLKIIDFGLAIYQHEENNNVLCGTPGYIAPEILKAETLTNFNYSYKIDIFSAGVIFYKLLTKKNLF